MPKKVTIRVRKPFLLTHADHTQQAFPEGLHEVPPEVAAHWYVQAHAETVAAEEAKPAEAEAEAPKAETEAAEETPAVPETTLPEPSRKPGKK